MPLTLMAVPPGVDPYQVGEYGVSTGVNIGPKLGTTPWSGTWTFRIDVPIETYVADDWRAVLGHRFGDWFTAASPGWTIDTSDVPAPGSAVVDGDTFTVTCSWSPASADPTVDAAANWNGSAPLELLVDLGSGPEWVDDNSGFTAIGVGAAPGYVGNYFGWSYAAYDSDGFRSGPLSSTGVDTIPVRWDGTGLVPFGLTMPYIAMDIASSFVPPTIVSHTATSAPWIYSGYPVGSTSWNYAWEFDPPDFTSSYSGVLVLEFADGTEEDRAAYPYSYVDGRYELTLLGNYAPPPGRCEMATGTVEAVTAAPDAVLSVLEDNLTDGAAAHSIRFVSNTTGNPSPVDSLLSEGPWVLGPMDDGTEVVYRVRRLDGTPISGSAVMRVQPSAGSTSHWDALIACRSRSAFVARHLGRRGGGFDAGYRLHKV